MPSPFPGMDPYLEGSGRWKDFHSRFINAWSELIAERLPEGYEASIEEKVQLLQVSPERVKRMEPDVAVSWKTPVEASAPRPKGTATIEPVTIPHAVIEEETRESHIEILHRPDRTLVSVLELLSPSNKEEPGRSLYLQKRNAFLLQNVNLFELDLLVGGRRLPLRDPLPPGDYYALISRAQRRFDCDVYAWRALRPLPDLPVPLRSPDPDISIDLGQVLSLAYDRGRYARSLNYEEPPQIGLDSDVRRQLFEHAKSARRR